MLLALLAMWGSMNLIRSLTEALMSEAGKPLSNHADYATRLQRLRLDNGKIALVFDQWAGSPVPNPTSQFVTRLKDAGIGVQGVLFFEGTVVVDDDC